MMFFVYILRATEIPDQTYVGFTQDLKNRLQRHNAGHVRHTSKYRPWRLETYLAFSTKEQALAFERYLKTGSGRAFAKKRLHSCL
ncbi:GIY-YIG nuclease family protein [uncultured Algimonas sp.]|uniref:GIY-YIG nuclease family protein n=1 Tax=uncultured Algimonas sp. TaxID=1547920 RepID=UPI00260DEF27|nr:GIY-YIG nuclease family protein [uncultured Algimonas sp.]